MQMPTTSRRCLSLVTSSRRASHLLAAAATSLLSLGAAPALANAGQQTVCIFDILGTGGEGYSAAKDYAAAMQKAGANITLKAYVDERVAVEDFRTGQCDAVTATAMRTRVFNPLTASIDAIGATTMLNKEGKVDLPASFGVVRQVVETFSSPQAGKLMVNGGYEIAGIIPLGPAYPFVNDRKINSVEAAAGKRIAAFDHDKAQAALIQRVGAQAVSADITTFATKFNNGVVDVIVAPALVYKPLELQKGLGTKGAIARMPLVMLSYQMVLRPEKFPAGFGQKSREYWLGQFEHAQNVIMKSEDGVPAAAWMDLSPKDNARYLQMMREARIDVAKIGLYDKRGLKIIKRIRCAANPKESECSDQAEIDWPQ